MARRRQPPGLQEAMGNPSRRAAKHVPSRKRPIGHDIAVSPLLKGKEFRDARAIWARLAPQLARNNILAPTDADAFARYCVHLAEWRVFTEQINREGATQVVTTTTGDPMVRWRPETKLREIAERHLLDLEDRFGLNPRHRMAILRDMAALNVPAGDLFAWRDNRDGDELPASESAAAAPAAAEEADDDIIGFARRPPPGSPLN